MFYAILLVSVLMMWFLYKAIFKAYKNTQDVTINRIRVNGRVIGDESAHSSLQVLQLSDLHLENISITPERLVQLLQQEHIDLIAITGDFLDRKRTIPKVIPYLQALKRLNTTYGMYAVFGNHDYWLREDDFAELRKVLNEQGCRTLQNEHVQLNVGGTTVNVIGIDDYGSKRSDLEISYQGIEEGYNLILTHDPNIVLDMADCEFDYLLSGHFHGGQICWPKPYHLVKMGKMPRLNMIKGLHRLHGKPFYISEGLGQTGVNIRVGTRPEITLHQLGIHSQEKAGGKLKHLAG